MVECFLARKQQHAAVSLAVRLAAGRLAQPTAVGLQGRFLHKQLPRLAQRVQSIHYPTPAFPAL